jgi:hypothetical protein
MIKKLINEAIKFKRGKIFTPQDFNDICNFKSSVGLNEYLQISPSIDYKVHYVLKNAFESRYEAKTKEIILKKGEKYIVDGCRGNCFILLKLNDEEYVEIPKDDLRQFTFGGVYKKPDKYGCKKRHSLRYYGIVFDAMKNSQVGGNYPYGGEIIAKVDKDLLKVLKQYMPDDAKKIKVGDCVIMNNGWSEE